jgi:hypothetical protein
MKDMQWYNNAVKALEDIQTVDQKFSVKVELGTSIHDILKSESPLIEEVCKGFSFETKL